MSTAGGGTVYCADGGSHRFGGRARRSREVSFRLAGLLLWVARIRLSLGSPVLLKVQDFRVLPSVKVILEVGFALGVRAYARSVGWEALALPTAASYNEFAHQTEGFRSRSTPRAPHPGALF